eukprot:RCo000804
MKAGRKRNEEPGLGAPFTSVVARRSAALVVLLLLQSMSSFILVRYDDIVRNTMIPLFLTMLVGAGGNAGNQATVRSIGGLLSGEYRFTKKQCLRVLRRELCIGLVCATLLAVVGFVRVHVLLGAEEAHPMRLSLAIALSLFLIVTISNVVGCLLPFALKLVKMDPEHAGPAIQVIMDILGVLITCVIAQWLLG